MGKPKKRRGHFCWSCDEVRPNERFSGKGHSRHLCKDCQKLGRDELELRQAQRDIERLLHWDGAIRRKRRRELDRFLAHQNPRVRAYAEEVVRADAERHEVDAEASLPWVDLEERNESILVDAHGDADVLVAFFEAIRERIRFPQEAFVAGQPVTVREVTFDGSLRRGLEATCVTPKGDVYAIGLADVVFAATEAARCLSAYRRWLGLPTSSSLPR